MACSLLCMLLPSILVFSLIVSGSASFHDSVEVTWGDQRAQIVESGQLLTLSLDQASGSGFQSKDEYLFGQISIKLKLVSGNSAGTVTTFYFSSIGDNHDEIDFEFLGNVSGQPYTLHTNVFCQGKGDREQQFYLWFDPTADFHTYTIIWNQKNIIFIVDDTPIRVFKNNEANGAAYPNDQAMRVYSTLWNADDWATQGGRVKTDWSKAPFVASYREYNAQACTVSAGSSSSSCSSGGWMNQELDAQGKGKIAWVQKKFMVYNYCADTNRFPQGLPTECGQD